VRLLEVVGEAASRVPVSERARYSGIPWVQIVGLRNRLICLDARESAEQKSAGIRAANHVDRILKGSNKAAKRSD
jgi:hypothetical protein